jgi:hypothetical protein
MKIHHIWDGHSSSLCGVPVQTADTNLHHFEEDEDCADCEICLHIQAGVEREN